MSWWVMEQVSVNDDGTQSLVNIQCDDVSDLPSPNQTVTAGYTIVRGSQAKVLATSENYILGGSGTWVKMEDGVKLDLTGYATEQYVDDGLSDKVDTSVYSSGQAAQDAEIAYSINTGAKNLFKIRDPVTNTRNNVTFVVNADGTVDVSTTSDGASAQTDLTIGTVNTYGGVTYKLTGCPSGVTGRCACGTGGTGSVIDTGSGALLTSTADSSRSPFIRVYNGAVITTPVKFYPMIRLAKIKDDTFEPYAPTNRELYEMILALQ